MDWISVEDKLPEVIIDKNGRCNCVLIYKKDGFDCGSDFQVWNTEYFNINPFEITHWMPLPDPPKEAP